MLCELQFCFEIKTRQGGKGTSTSQCPPQKPSQPQWRRRAILGLAADPTGGGPALLEVAIKPFPWPASIFDPGAAAAALAFNLLLVFAFLVPTRGIVTTIVREKELRLREGMRIFGLQVCSLSPLP